MVDGEIHLFGGDRASVDPVDVEQSVQRAGRRAQGIVESCDELLGFIALDELRRQPPQRRERLKRLAKVVMAAARKRRFAIVARSACCIASASAVGLRLRSVMSVNVITTPPRRHHGTVGHDPGG